MLEEGGCDISVYAKDEFGIRRVFFSYSSDNTWADQRSFDLVLNEAGAYSVLVKESMPSNFRWFFQIISTSGGENRIEGIQPYCTQFIH